MPKRRKFLVTGATGQQGGAVARCLLRKGRSVRVMTRSPEKAHELAGLGAEVVRGDFEDRESLHECLRDVGGVFLVGTPFEKGVRAEIEQGEAAVLACWRFGTPHVVYSSVCGADRNTGIPHFESKALVERSLREVGQPCTILRPVWFMENFESPWLLPSIQDGVLATPLDPDRNLQMVSLSDIAEFASAALMQPERFIGKAIDLAGDEWTMTDIALQISCAMNRPVRYERIPDDKVEAAVGHDFALMYRWLNRQGYDVNIQRLRDEHGIPLTSFSKYLGRSGLYRRAA